MASTIDDLQVKFSADIKDITGKIDQVSSKFSGMEARVRQSTDRIGNSFSALNRFLSAGVLLAGVSKLISLSSEMDNLGDSLVSMEGKANVGIEALQRLRLVAAQNGSSAESLDSALVKLNKSIGEARGGSDEMRKVFAAMGLSKLIKDGSGTEAVFYGVADALKQINEQFGPQVANAYTLKVMGKSADDLGGFMNQGAKAVLEMATAVPQAAVVSSDLAHKLDDMADKTAQFNMMVKQATAQLEGAFVDSINFTSRALDVLQFKMGGMKAAGSGLASDHLVMPLKPWSEVQGAPKPPPLAPLGNVKTGLGNGDAKADEARRRAIEATKRYDETIAELTNKIQNLSMSEEAAAYNEELFSNLKRAGVKLDSERGDAIAVLTAKLDDEMRAKEAIAQADAAAAEAGQKWIDMKQQAGDAVASAFEKAIVEGENLRQVFSGLLADLAKMIFQKLVFEQISNAVSGGLGSIVGGFASGGGINAGNSYMVGERGPELFVPKVPGNIIPANRSGGTAGGFTYAPVINSNGGNTEEIRRMLDQDKRDLIRLMPKLMVDKQRRNALGDAFSHK